MRSPAGKPLAASWERGTDMHEVSKDEFFAGIGNQNVHPRIVGPWPYTSLFETPGREVRGKIVTIIPAGEALEVSRYYLVAAEDA
jgi:hypothetical protein